jgi:hypothetical protein
MDPAAVIDQIERGFDAKLHLVPKLFGHARERRGDSKPNLIIGHPADGGGARRNGGLSGRKTRLFRGFFGVPCKLRGRICTEPKYLVHFGRKVACGEQRNCRSYRCSDDEASRGGEPPDSPRSSRRGS